MGATVTGPPDAALELRGLEKRFGTNLAVAGVDLAVPHGAFLVLLGPSGCGKTTILRMLAGLEVPTGGELCLDGPWWRTGGAASWFPRAGATSAWCSRATRCGRT